MTIVINLINEIIQDLWMHKIRSLLVLLGIILGTAAVILLLALGGGFYEYQKTEIMNIMDNSFFILPSVTSQNYRGIPKGQRVKIKADSVIKLKRRNSYIKLISPVIITRASIGYKESKESWTDQGKRVEKEVYGVSPDFF